VPRAHVANQTELWLSSCLTLESGELLPALKHDDKPLDTRRFIQSGMTLPAVSLTVLIRLLSRAGAPRSIDG